MFTDKVLKLAFYYMSCCLFIVLLATAIELYQVTVKLSMVDTKTYCSKTRLYR